MWRYCEKNSDVIWYCELQCERNSSHIVTHIVRRLWVEMNTLINCFFNVSYYSFIALTIKTSTSLEKKHICPICSRGFKRSDNLKAHARTVHYGVKANNCSACGKGYRTKNELLKHQTKTCPYREMIRSQDEDFNLDFDESLLIWVS